jgi:pentatricopeptide repeat protein
MPNANRTNLTFGAGESRGWIGKPESLERVSLSLNLLVATHTITYFRPCRCPPMPRCAARHVKLVAEAEQLVLPFLAPRVFQPWPSHTPSPSHAQKKSFSTTSCEYARQSRSSRPTRQKYNPPPKYESARSLLVQQWYESAIAPLEEEEDGLQHDDQEQAKPKKKGKKEQKVEKKVQQSPTENKRRLRRADVLEAYFQRWSTSQAIVKSRWTVAKRSSTTRTKYTSLGRPVRRKVRGAPAEDKTEELVFSADGHTLYWQHHFAKLNARYDTNLSHPYTPKPSPNLNFHSQKWAAQILNAKDFKSQEELAALLGNQWRRKWIHALLWTLANRVDDALRLLETTHISPYMPAAYVADALGYLVRHHFKTALSDDIRERLISVTCTLMDRPGTSPLQLTGSTFRKFMLHCTEQQVMKLSETIAVTGTPMHWNTHLHFATYFARHNRFDDALDTLLDAVSEGADVSSKQFESCCATLLRQAAGQLDGLRVSLRLVQNLSDIGVKLNVQLCNIVMLNAVEAGDLKTAFSIYHSLIDNNLVADEYTHAILLKGCKTVIEDSETLNTTIRQAIADVGSRNLHVVATEIIHCLYLHHFQIDPENAFTTISEAYMQLFDSSDLINLGILSQNYANKTLNRQKPTFPVMGIMIGAHLRHITYSQSRNMGHVYDLYRRWRTLAEQNISPYVFLAQHDYVSNAFLLAFSSDLSGLPYAAEVIRDMQTPFPTHPRPQKKPTVRSWSIFLHAFAKHGKMDLAEQVLKFMRERKQTPNNVTWNSLLGGYARAGKADKAVETCVRMRDAGFEADEVTKRHFGKIKLDGVARSAWRDVRGNEQMAQQSVEEVVDSQSGYEETEDANELVEGVRTMSV